MFSIRTSLLALAVATMHTVPSAPRPFASSHPRIARHRGAQVPGKFHARGSKLARRMRRKFELGMSGSF